MSTSRKKPVSKPEDKDWKEDFGAYREALERELLGCSILMDRMAGDCFVQGAPRDDRLRGHNVFGTYYGDAWDEEV